MSANIKTWQERTGNHNVRPGSVKHMIAEITELRAALAATATTVSKPCFMCNGTGQHEIPLAIPAGVEPLPARMVACQQFKAAPTVAVDDPTFLDIMGMVRAQMHRVYSSAIDRDDIDSKHMVEIEAAIRGLAARAKLSAGVAIPEGWALVPVEPTEEMLFAAFLRDENAYAGGAQNGASASAIWDAMLAAAPSPDQQE